MSCDNDETVFHSCQAPNETMPDLQGKKDENFQKNNSDFIAGVHYKFIVKDHFQIITFETLIV